MKNQELTNQVFSDGAEKYAEKFMSFDDYHSSFDFFLNLVNNTNAKILDTACGPGNITNYLLTKNPELKIKGTDLAPKMIDLARELNPTAEFEIKDILQIEEKFDGIICGFGLPYLNKEEAIHFIKKCSKALNKDGVLYLSTMEDDYSKSSFQAPSSGEGPSLFIHYHQADYLMDTLVDEGFKIELEERKTYEHTAEKSFIDLFLIARKIK